MVFRPRQFPEILDDMINFVRANTRLTDFTVGSVIRTLLEAAAIEDDEQYFQMVQLLDSFSIRTASGFELDARVADYNIVRLQPTNATGDVYFRDGNLITDSTAYDSVATDTTIELESTERFPTAGYPYVVRIGEGTTAVEDVTVSNNNTTTSVLTITALANDHDLGVRVSLVTGAADISIAAGVQVQVPASGDDSAIVYATTEQSVIVNGNYESTPANARAVDPGVEGNIGSEQITQFASAAPFSRAEVINKASFTGGSEVESDSALRDRATNSLAALSNGTPLALKEAVLGVTDPVSGKIISTASVLEDFSNDEVIIYVDDGSGFVPDQTILPRDSISGTYGSTGLLSMNLYDVSEFPTEGYILLSPESAQAEIVEFIDVDYNTGALTFDSGTPTANTHDDLDEAAMVDILTLSSAASDLFYPLEKRPIVRSSQRLWVGSSLSNLTLQTEGVDYYINKARGRIEFLAPVLAGSVIAASYTYYTGLIFYAQRVINGDPNDEVNYPGVVAAGIEATVETPSIRRVTIRLAINALDGFEESDLAPLVRTEVENYVTGLGIGEDVIVSEIIERAMGVDGMYNVNVAEPTTDLSTAANELPVAVSATGTSLVTVS